MTFVIPAVSKNFHSDSWLSSNGNLMYLLERGWMAPITSGISPLSVGWETLSWKAPVAKNLSVASTCESNGIAFDRLVSRLNRASKVRHKSVLEVKIDWWASHLSSWGDLCGPWRLTHISPVRFLLSIVSPPLQITDWGFFKDNDISYSYNSNIHRIRWYKIPLAIVQG